MDRGAWRAVVNEITKNWQLGRTHNTAAWQCLCYKDSTDWLDKDHVAQKHKLFINWLFMQKVG